MTDKILKPLYVNGGYGFYDCDIDIEGSNIRFGSFINILRKSSPIRPSKIFSNTEYSDNVYMYFNEEDFVTIFYLYNVNHKLEFDVMFKLGIYNIIRKGYNSNTLRAARMYHAISFIVNTTRDTIKIEGVDAALSSAVFYNENNPQNKFEFKEEEFRETLEMFQQELSNESSIKVIQNSKEIIRFASAASLGGK